MSSVCENFFFNSLNICAKKKSFRSFLLQSADSGRCASGTRKRVRNPQFFRRMQWERAAAGVEATFSLPAAKCDNLTCDNFGLAALADFIRGHPSPMLPAPALCSHFCPLVYTSMYSPAEAATLAHGRSSVDDRWICRFASRKKIR